MDFKEETESWPSGWGGRYPGVQPPPPPKKKYKQSKFGVFREFPGISASKPKYSWQVYIGIWGGEIPVCYHPSLNSLVLIILIRINQPDGRRCSSCENMSNPFLVRFQGKEYFSLRYVGVCTRNVHIFKMIICNMTRILFYFMSINNFSAIKTVKNWCTRLNYTYQISKISL